MSKITYTLIDETITFSGILDETVGSDFFENSLSVLTKEDDHIKMDFSGVSSGNSMGIRNLHMFLTNTDKKVRFVNVPLWLLEQFGMNSRLIKDPSSIYSVYLPFYSHEKEHDIYHIWIIGKDIPILDDYDDFEIPKVHSDGTEYQPDFDFESAFSIFTSTAS